MVWREDILGPPFEALELPLGADEEGPVVATLVRRPAPCAGGRAVLHVHGYMDYFFQAEAAERYVEQGLSFYGLDLRKYGRSIRPHQTLNFCRRVEEYFEELERAVEIIREHEGHERLLLSGHSTGGLIASLYAHQIRGQGKIDALFLNSPFFDFAEDWITRAVLLELVDVVGGLQPHLALPVGLSSWYAKSIHRDFHGRWDYNLKWCPVEGIPTRAGWVRAMHRGHRRLQAGLAIDCPVLVMTSGASIRPRGLSEELFRADAVLDVEQMWQHCLGLGEHVTRVKIAGGVHDLVLSAEPVRERVFEALFRWVGAYLPE